MAILQIHMYLRALNSSLLRWQPVLFLHLSAHLRQVQMLPCLRNDPNLLKSINNYNQSLFSHNSLRTSDSSTIHVKCTGSLVNPFVCSSVCSSVALAVRQSVGQSVEAYQSAHQHPSHMRTLYHHLSTKGCGPSHMLSADERE